MSRFIELTLDGEEPYKFTVNVDWIKAILPAEQGARIIIGDGRPGVGDDGLPPELFIVKESYGHVVNILATGIKIDANHPF